MSIIASNQQSTNKRGNIRRRLEEGGKKEVEHSNNRGVEKEVRMPIKLREDV